MTKTVIVLDTETTGFQRYDRIVSLAAIKASHDGDDSETLYRCFDPRKDSHPGAAATHGWDNWTTRFQDLFADHASELREWFSSADILVTHNAEFDLHFVNREFRKANLPPLTAPAFCTLERAREVWSGGAKLDLCAKRLGLLRTSTQHHPVEDAFFAWNLYRHFNGLPTLKARSSWPAPENFRSVEPRPPGALPRRTAKRPGGANLRWSAAQRRQVTATARPAAVLLVFLALADDNFAPQEKAIIWDVARMTADRMGLPGSDLDIEVVAADLLDVEPSGNLITRAMKAVLDDDYWRENLPRFMTATVLADGIFVPSERSALDVIKQALLRQRRFDPVH